MSDPAARASGRSAASRLRPSLFVRLIEFVAGLTGLAALGVLIALTAYGAEAQQPPQPGDKADPAGAQKRGFAPGSNPFAGQAPPAGGAFFDEDEEDFDDESFGNPGAFPPPSAGANRGAPPPAFPPSSGNPSNISVTPNPKGGVSLGGSPPGGVIGKAQAPLTIDDNTAEGSKIEVTDFNFPDADIMDIAKTLGKLTGKNFIFDKDVKGRISIISNGTITVGDAWKAFLTALDMSGFALIPSGKYIRIARNRDARDKQLKTYTGDYSPDTDALITRLFPLKYLSADEVARNFRSFMPANSRIIPYEQTNTVIVTDTGANIAKLQKLLEILDIEGYDAGIEVIPVQYASAAELSKLIDTLIPGTSTAPTAGTPRFGGGKFTSRRTKEGGVINTIISDERTNTLIVHANSKGADQVRELVSKLDKKLTAAKAGGKVHVVYLQFAEAEQIANTLNNFSQAAQQRPSGPTGGTGVNPVQQSLFEGAIKVSPDKATNSLVITASPSDFVTVQRVIHKLDIPRDQVYAEVVIMEMTISRNSTFSSTVINPANGVGFTPGTEFLEFFQNPISQKGAILSFKDGTGPEVTIGGVKQHLPNVAALIKALQTNSNANVLATPQIMTLDNTEATFEAAEKIPVLSSTAVNGAVAQSTTKENVSLSITIKPQINKLSNFVKLDITAKLEDFSGRELPAQVANQALATTSRNAKTSIVVGDMDTVVLGGLTRDTVQETINKVPLLGDIPLLGWLFKSRNASTSKTNLLIFITPQIVRQYEKVRAILDKKLRQRDEFIESTTGGEDYARAARDEMIRDLPDIKELSNSKPANIQTIDAEDTAAGSISAPSSSSTPPSTFADPAAVPPAPPAQPVDQGPPPPTSFDQPPPASPGGLE